MSDLRDIAGYCPMGCGPETLVIAGEGRVTCTAPRCPDRTCVHRLLQDPETEHVVQFDEDGYTTLHPLRERGTDLFECTLHRELGELLTGPPGPGPGRYRVTRIEDGFSYTRLGGDDA